MKLKAILLYLLYFIGAVIFFMVFLFPQEQVASKINNDLNKNLFLASVNIKKAKLWLPAGLKFENSQITLKNRFDIRPEELKIRYDFLSLFKDQKTIKFDTSVFGGQVKGHAVDFSLADLTCSQLFLNGSQIKGEKVKYKTSLFEVELNFKLNADYNYPDKKKQSKGKGQLIFENLNLKLSNSLFNEIGISSLVFENAEFDFLLDDKEIIITKITAIGNFVNIKLTGDIKPVNRFSKNSFEQSFLDLKGHIIPRPALISKLANVSSLATVFKDSKNSGVPIKITGTIKEPKIEL